MAKGPANSSVTERGFAVYDDFTDRYGHRIRVQRSSLATEAAVWIFTDDEQGSAHLTVEMAVRVRDALDKFITEQEGRE
jgi:hypothetical protein